MKGSIANGHTYVKGINAELRVAARLSKIMRENYGKHINTWATHIPIMMAREAIDELRVPTDDMIDMGGRGIARDTQYFGGAMTLARYSSHEVEAQNRLRAAAAWSAAVDAASPPDESDE